MNDVKSKFKARKLELKKQNNEQLTALTNDLIGIKNDTVNMGKKVTKTSLGILGGYIGLKVISWISGSKKKNTSHIAPMAAAAPAAPTVEASKGDKDLGNTIKKSLAENLVYFLVSLAKQKMQNELSGKMGEE
ncbi:hypothetical protein [Persicobacter diffluens]|uniref:Uncharacterized protein n=1 Tax=Persicobacter diffluens TaxID=981 RepID=A0AAN4W0H3_9BACT|nr:hypothetical protein PEDI_29100 [Persicobacter diffluens]